MFINKTDIYLIRAGDTNTKQWCTLDKPKVSSSVCHLQRVALDVYIKHITQGSLLYLAKC